MDERQNIPDKGARSKTRQPWNARFVFVTSVVYLTLPATAYSLGVLNTPAQHIKDFINDTHMQRTGEAMASRDIESLFGLMTAVIGLGAGVGSLVSSYLMDAIGRKYGLVVATVTTAAGYAIMTFSKTAASYEMIFVGRVIVGIATGLGLTIALAYVVETCVPEIKPTLASICQLLQSFANLTANVLGFEEVLGSSELWPYLLGFPVVLCGLQLVLLIPFCPESPRYLLMKKHSSEDARKALQLLRGREDVEEDIKELNRELEESKLDAHTSMADLFTSPTLRRPLIVTIALGWYRSWSGYNGIFMFSTQLFVDVGMAERAAKYATSGTGILLFLGNLLTPFMIARYKRRNMYYVGAVGMGVCSGILAITMAYKDAVDFLKYVNIVASLSLIAFSATGQISLFWVVVAELYPHSARGSALGVAVQNAYLSFFALCYIFPEMFMGMHDNAFFVFTGINALMIVFVRFVLPETKSTSIATILNLLESDESQAKKKTANKVPDLAWKQEEVEQTHL